VFRLYDAATGQASPVRSARPGELRIWVAGGLRSYLVADLIRRVAQRHHLLVSVWQQEPAALDGLNIYPAEFSGRPPEPFDVAVAGADQVTGAPPAHRMEPGEVRPGAPDVAGLDPLALRLALLEHHYRVPAALARGTLEAADQTLRDWRGLVASWALSPSKPMCAQYVGDFLGALDDDLDSPAALRALGALADDAVIPPGSRFETFAYLDQLLGLDLVRDVGRTA
jgi:hypothetical protein